MAVPGPERKEAAPPETHISTVQEVFPGDARCHAQKGKQPPFEPTYFAFELGAQPDNLASQQHDFRPHPIETALDAIGATVNGRRFLLSLASLNLQRVGGAQGSIEVNHHDW